jgi:hypothetical protein
MGHYEGYSTRIPFIVSHFLQNLNIILLFEQMKSGDFKDKSGKFLTNRRIFSEINPPILTGTHIFILNQLHKNT